MIKIDVTNLSSGGVGFIPSMTLTNKMTEAKARTCLSGDWFGNRPLRQSRRGCRKCSVLIECKINKLWQPDKVIIVTCLLGVTKNHHYCQYHHTRHQKL